MPNTARAISLRPAPTRPASATISPARTVERHVLEHPDAGQPTHLEHDVADVGVRLFGK
jgi:hypothetical protein